MPTTPNSIFDSIKKKLGPAVLSNFFDDDILSYINTYLSRLNTIGIGTPGFKVTDSTQTWTDFEPLFDHLCGIDTYVYLRCRLVFDPPQNSNITAVIEKQIDELTWTLEVQARQLKEDLADADD
jgi:hypothetical protein